MTMPHKDPEAGKAYHRKWSAVWRPKHKDRRNAWQREYRKLHPPPPAARTPARRIKERRYQQLRRERVWKHKRKPCMDCGVQYSPWIMDFDHVRGEKCRNIASLSNRWSEERLLTEIMKCDVVCANCHRDRTYIRSKHPRMDTDMAADTKISTPGSKEREEE